MANHEIGKGKIGPGWRIAKKGARFVLWQCQDGTYLIEDGLWSGSLTGPLENRDKAERTFDSLESGEFQKEFLGEQEVYDFVAYDISKVKADLWLVDSPFQVRRPNWGMDILAKDTEDSLVYIKTKLKTAGSEAVDQVRRNMAGLRETFSPTKLVKGIVIAKDFDNEAKNAAGEVPPVALLRYKWEKSWLQFEPIEPSERELKRRKELVARILKRRDELPPLGMTTAELVRLARQGLESYDET